MRVGSVNFLGPNTDFGSSSISDRTDVAKIPVVVKGIASATLSVPDSETGRFGLDYGDFDTEQTVKGAAKVVRFEPCSRLPRTGWPGGLTLTDRRPVMIEVRIGDGRAKEIELGQRRR